MFESELFGGESKCLRRGGVKYRSGKKRLFFVKKVGWFLAVRGETEINAGIENRQLMGPFKTKVDAKRYLYGLISRECPHLVRRPQF